MLKSGAFVLLAPALAVAQSEWKWLNPRPQGHDLYGATWAGSRFVAVGDYGTVAVSAEGRGWTAAWSGDPRRLHAVTWALPPDGNGSGLLVAVGEAGAILTSTDAAAWTAGSSGSARDLSGVAYGAGLFVAVGEGGTILTSPDGAAWMKRASGTDEPLAAVAWADTQFVAVSGEAILTSADGISWTRRNSGVGNVLRGVGWGNGRIVAVGDDATILTSEDGREWSLRNRGVWQLRGVVWAGDRFVAAGKYGYARMSRDGIAWDSAYAGVGDDFNAIAWNGGAGISGSVAMVGHGGAISSSADFAAWETGDSGIRGILRAIAADGAGFKVVAGDDGLILSGSGGSFLTRDAGTSNGFRAVARSPHQWLAAGWLGVSRSADGIAWTSDSGRGYDPRCDFHSVIWMDSASAGAGRFVAVGLAGVIQTSGDGTAWTLRDSGRAAVLYSVACSVAGEASGPERLIAVGDGPILASADAAASWKEVNPRPRTALRVVAAGMHGFLAAGEGGLLLTSPNGVSWRERNSGTAQNLYAAAWTGRQWMVAGEAGLVLRSSDGDTWSASFVAGATFYALLPSGSGGGSGDASLLMAGSGGALLAVREDFPAGNRIRPGQKPGRGVRLLTGGLFPHLTATWPDRNRIMLYDITGSRRGIGGPGRRAGARIARPMILMP